jgi:hypothetical protein
VAGAKWLDLPHEQCEDKQRAKVAEIRVEEVGPNAARRMNSTQ